MGTKQTYEEILNQLYEKAERMAAFPDEFKTTIRYIELAEVCKSLGLFCYAHEDDETPTVSYKGHTYVFDMVEPHQLGFYVDVASFDDDDEDVRQEMYICFNEANWCSFLMSLYEVRGQVVLSSCQYVGERKIFPEDVVFMLKQMDKSLRDFQERINSNQYLKENVTCV